MDTEPSTLLERYSDAMQAERLAWVALQALPSSDTIYPVLYDRWRAAAGFVTALGNELWKESGDQ